MIEALDVLTFTLLAMTALLCVARVLRRGSIPDKVLGTDSLVLVVVAGVAAGIGITERRVYLDVLVVVTMLGFVATLTVARFVERRGARG